MLPESSSAGSKVALAQQFMKTAAASPYLFQHRVKLESKSRNSAIVELSKPYLATRPLLRLLCQVIQNKKRALGIQVEILARSFALFLPCGLQTAP